MLALGLIVACAVEPVLWPVPDLELPATVWLDPWETGSWTVVDVENVGLGRVRFSTWIEPEGRPVQVPDGWWLLEPGQSIAILVEATGAAPDGPTALVLGATEATWTVPVAAAGVTSSRADP